MLDLAAAQRVAERWPTPIVYSGFEIGQPVMTGGRMTDPGRNPVAKAYERFPAGGVGTIGSSSSYDQTMVYFAVRGVMADGLRLWKLSPPGTVQFPAGRTVFTPAQEGRCRYLIADAAPEAVAHAIEALMIQPPLRGSK